MHDRPSQQASDVAEWPLTSQACLQILGSTCPLRLHQ